MTRSTVFLSILALICCSAFALAQDEPKVSMALRNESITASFDGRGLTSIRDNATSRAIGIANESSFIQTDKHWLDCGGSKPVDIQKSADSITYIYKFDGTVTIRSTYEIKPGWKFVSKQLTVAEDGGDVMHVKKVEAFRGRLLEPVAYEFPIDRGWKGIWAGMVRFTGLTDNDPGLGMFLLIQNPLMKWTRYYQDVNLSYEPDMDWQKDWGPFVTDRVCVGVYPLSGHELPTAPLSDSAYTRSFKQMLEWNRKIDVNEAAALQDCVRAFLMKPLPEKSTRIDVGWCYNDYQIDLGTPEGRKEYKRIIDRAAQMGIDNILLAAANNDVSSLSENRDCWGWENCLWLGMGQKIRKGEWDPAKDPIPASLKEMLDYAKSKKVNFVAYVYPTVPFMQDLEWTKWCKNQPGGYDGPDNGIRSFQDFLIKKLVDFQKATGIAGYSFDLWYLNGGTSHYAQWFGMRRVMEELKKQVPNIIIDGRQTHHAYGPWTSLSGCYPHPFGFDEQPGSFRATPDLHTDRLSANHMRSMNWMFRMQGFFPVELTPGYINHQTQRGDAKGTLRKDRFRPRDWDYLGWQYSLISSIGTAPFNHVANYIPARDEEEYKAFSKEDQEWFKGWMDWTDRNRETLRKLRPFTTSPAIGRWDGTAAIDGDHGFVFLFNPNYRKMTAEFTLDSLIGLTKGREFIISEIYPLESRLIGKPGAGVWKFGDKVKLELEGANAMVLEICTPLVSAKPLVYNSIGDADLKGTKLELTNITGEKGTSSDLIVTLPFLKKISSLTINGFPAAFEQKDMVITTKASFTGERFSQCQQIGKYDPNNTGKSFTGEFTIPKRIFDQLAARKKAWPVNYTDDDLLATWLGPDRLLLLISIADANPKMAVSAKIDGKPAEVKQAWNGIYPSSGDQTFIGNYIDISNLKPDTKYKLEVTLPQLEPGRFLGVYFDNVVTEYTRTLAEH